MNETEKIIYHHIGFDDSWIIRKWVSFIFGLFVSLANGFLLVMMIAAIFVQLLEISFLFPIVIVVSLFVGLLIFYFLRKYERNDKSSYKIYEDRIELFNEKTQTIRDIIFLKEIDQVRFEDDFGKSYSSNVPSSSYIYCYFKNGYKARSKKIKKDRLKLYVKRDQERENRVIKILQFFQKKKKQVYISTKSGKIKTALNLKNWTDPGISPSIRI